MKKFSSILISLSVVFLLGMTTSCSPKYGCYTALTPHLNRTGMMLNAGTICYTPGEYSVTAEFSHSTKISTVSQ